MSERRVSGQTRRGMAWLAWGLSLLAVGMAAGAIAISMPHGRLADLFGPSLVTGAAMGLVGGLVASRRPGQPIGWILLVIAVTQAADEFSAAYARQALLDGGSLPLGDIFSWLAAWLWVPGLLVMSTFLLLLFPDGRLPSPRWRWLAGLAAATLVAATGFTAVGAWSLRGAGLLSSAQDSGPPNTAVVLLAFTVVVACMLASLASLFVRYRFARAEERHQLKWITYAATLLILAVFLSAGALPLPTAVAMALADVLVAAFPAALAIAILRYRLYDIDIVISRTLVYGSLAAFITGVYIAIVVGLGSLVGSGGRPNLALSIIATAVVAVAFQPVRERLQRAANHVVYGRRASPYEVLSHFSEHVSGSLDGEDVLARMARVLGEATGAERTDVWLRSGRLLRPAASWPADSRPAEAVSLDGHGALAGDALPGLPGSDRAVPVRHQGELLGALAAAKPRGESLTPVDEKLLSDLATQAGIVLRNARLTAELVRRLEELRASRQRLVATQDGERRRLERNLHDGAQQNVVALKVKLGLAELLIDRDPARVSRLLNDIGADTDQALETLRDLARGIYPPLLAARGLVAALEAQARKATVPVQVTASDVERYPQEIEAAVYFCCLEALQNATKYAEASLVRVVLAAPEGVLTFVVDDDGKGFDMLTTKSGSGLQNMRDRLDALGGALEIRSAPRLGTTLRGRVPIPVGALVS